MVFNLLPFAGTVQVDITEDHTRLYVDVGYYGYVSSDPACCLSYRTLSPVLLLPQWQRL